MQDVFQRVGTLPSCRLRLMIRCSGSPSSAAQVFRSLGHTLSGPAAFLGRSFLSCLLTWSVVMWDGDWVEVEVEEGGALVSGGRCVVGRRRDGCSEGEGEGGGGGVCMGWLNLSNLLKKSFSSFALST